MRRVTQARFGMWPFEDIDRVAEKLVLDGLQEYISFSNSMSFFGGRSYEVGEQGISSENRQNHSTLDRRHQESNLI